ncbi:MAG: hypothetical protein ACM3PF_05460 [Bacteroidota bacterium]
MGSSRTALVAALLTAMLVAAAPRDGFAARIFLPLDQEGSWTAADKQVHFGVCLAIAASFRVEGRSRAQSVTGSFAVGVAKEIYDVTLKPGRLGRGASRKDLAVDLLGAVAGVLIVAAADR